MWQEDRANSSEGPSVVYVSSRAGTVLQVSFAFIFVYCCACEFCVFFFVCLKLSVLFFGF